MLRTDLHLGQFATVAGVHQGRHGELIRVTDGSSRAMLAYVPDTPDRARRELEMMAAVKFAGVPTCLRAIEGGAGAAALVFSDAADARPLALVHDLPEATLRSGLAALLSTLRFVHSRGIVHGRIDRGLVLVDPSGRFWLTGWADARPVANARPVAGTMSEVSSDLRDLARAFREALLRRPWPDPAGATIHERDPRTPAGQELLDAGVKVDRDFARVVSRLVSDDPREAYTGASDVLADVGSVEAVAFDPWESLPAIGIRREFGRVMRFLDATRLPVSETVRHAASIEYVGPGGSGRSRLLAELARMVRARDVIVLTADGAARGSWGGVGAFARQLVQLLGRTARVCAQHDEALRHLLGDEPARDASPRGADAEGRESVAAQCTAAMTDLVRLAFRRTPGLLLLDDEHRLTVSARRVWRSMGQYVQGVNDGGNVLRALLVSSSDRAVEAELGADRVVVELKPWQPRDLEQFLAGAFAAPGGSREAGAAIHRVAGGRPADVLAYLRELERRGFLRREGLRWSPTEPLSALPPPAGDGADHVSRALDAAGRDARDFVEALAVGADVELPRSTLGDLCGLTGPRLAAAADASVAAGLVVVDGAGWRVRTGAVRRKVVAAVSDERRRVLHREILSHLLDASPDDVASIASHARAGADPRAADWTRRAVEQARDAGEWDAALRHLDDAATSVGSGAPGPDSELLRGELLTHAGRLAEAMEVLESLVGRLPEGDPTEAGARLVFARACYEGREWERLLAISLPGAGAPGERLAELRYLRAAALQHLNRAPEARRESRLAAAELDVPEPPDVALARLEGEYQERFYALDLAGARRHLLAKLRIEIVALNRRRYAIDLVRLANAIRVIRGPNSLVHAILVRAVYLCRTTPGISGNTLATLRTTLGLATIDSPRHRLRLTASAEQLAIQYGLGPYVMAFRIRLIVARSEAGRCTYADKQYIIQTGGRVAAMSPTEISAWGCEFSLCLVYYGLQDELELLLRRCTLSGATAVHSSIVRSSVIMGRILFDSDITSLLTSGDEGGDLGIWSMLEQRTTYLSRDFELAIVAYIAIRMPDRHVELTSRLGASHLVDLTRSFREPGWGAACLALFIALWSSVPCDDAQWEWLNKLVQMRPTPLPIGLEWQRLLLESRRLRSLSDWRGAETIKCQAERQLGLLLRSEHGIAGPEAFARWRNRLDDQNRMPTQATKTPRSSGTRDGIGNVESAIPSVASRWDPQLRAADGNSSIVVISPHRRELEIFALRVFGINGCCVSDWRGFGGNELVLDPSRKWAVAAFPDLWTKREIADALRRTRSVSVVRRTFSLLTVPITEFRQRGSEERALSEAIDGKLIHLPPLCANMEGRWSAFLTHVRSISPRAAVDHDVAHEVAQYTWPGGLGEIETVVSLALDVDPARISKDSLAKGGWLERVSAADEQLGDAARAILASFSANAVAASISEIASATQRPARTILRHLAELVRDGKLVRRGRGRATRYDLPSRRNLVVSGGPSEA